MKIATQKCIPRILSTNVKVLVPSRCQTQEATKKFAYYKNLKNLENTVTRRPEWENAKPFDSIPGPQPYPIIGNTWRFLLPKIGTYWEADLLDVYRKLNEQYGDVVILKGLHGKKPMVVLFSPKDFETLRRNEGVWPVRSLLPSITQYRKARLDVMPVLSLVALQGENWFKVRSMVNPILMQPRNVLMYVEEINSVADELVDNIKYYSQQNVDGEMPDYFKKEIYKWSLESICVVMLNKHLGCLQRDAADNSENKALIDNIMEMFDLMYKLDVLPIASSSDWKKYFKVCDYIVQTTMKNIKEFSNELGKETTEKGVDETILYKLIELDPALATTITVDTFLAGIDTTSKAMAAALYFLSKNPDKQELLRNESIALLKDKDSPVTKEVLSKATYLKAVLKESARLETGTFGIPRTAVKDLVLGGYQIPKGTHCMTANLLLCKRDEHFPRAAEFLPERWLSSTTGELSHKNANPFIFAPFGYGARGCIGKRLANLKLETAILKIIRNFELNWPHEDMVFKTWFGMTKPLKIHVKPLHY